MENHSSPKLLAVVPARYGSQRFPGKPLVPIAGVPMVVRALRQAEKAMVRLGGQAVVATDDERIAEVVKDSSGQVCLTRSDHPTGTDRLWEVVAGQPNADIIVNVQGDEPFISPVVITQAVEALQTHANWDMATLITPMAPVDVDNPNAVKAVVTPVSAADNTYRALYFTRALAPYARNDRQLPVYRHLGLYVYRRSALEAFVNWQPSPLEQTESLEQLRALENGLTIGAVAIEEAPLGVDTPDDVASVEAWAQQAGLIPGVDG